MRIGINAYGMAPGWGGSEETFFRWTLAEMVRLQNHTEFVVLTDNENDGSFDGVETCNVEKAGGFNVAIEKSGADLLFSSYTRIREPVSCPYFALALEMPAPQVAEKSKGFFKSKAGYGAQEVLDGAALVVCPSEYMKKSMLDTRRIPLNKISVALPGVADVFGEEQRCIVEQPYALMVGRTHSSKNIAGAVEAFYKVAGEVDHNLVIVGRPGDAEPSDWGERAIRFDWLGSAQLAGMFQHADLLIHSAYDDGTGLTVLEAMKSGCLVASGRVGAIPEIARDAPLYFNAESGDSMVGVIRRALREEGGDRLRRITSGKQQIVERTWESCAWKLLSLFSKSGI